MNAHDIRAMDHLAGSFHEAAHAAVGLKLGRKLERLTRHETKFVRNLADTDSNRAAISFAGALAVAKFDNGQNRHTADDSGDVEYRTHLNLSPADTELARATAAAVVTEEWQHICDLAFALALDGELSPQRVADILHGDTT